MYSKELLNSLMKAQNYTQYKQAASELGFTTAYIAQVNTGKLEFTDETAIYIATVCQMDVQEVLLKLAQARAKNPETKNIWAQVLKRYCAGVEAAACAGLVVIAASPIAAFLASHTQAYVKRPHLS